MRLYQFDVWDWHISTILVISEQASRYGSPVMVAAAASEVVVVEGVVEGEPGERC